MAQDISFVSIPANSVMILPNVNRIEYYDRIFSSTPEMQEKIIFSTKSGAYIRGLAKSFRMPESNAPKISLAVLKVAIGDINKSELANEISKSLGVASDKAQKMADEINEDLFSTKIINRESKSRTSIESPSKENVLDLENKPKLTAPPPMPKI